MTIDSISSVL